MKEGHMSKKSWKQKDESEWSDIKEQMMAKFINMTAYTVITLYCVPGLHQGQGCLD